MPSILLLYHLLNSLILYLLPKKLRFLLPSSWSSNHQANFLLNKTPPSSSSSTVTTTTSSSSFSSGGGVSKRMDNTELRRVFQMFDRNGDGKITKNELSNSLENLGIFIPDSELTQMIENIDVNGDGCVDIEEFSILYQSIMDERDEEEDMREAFNVFDRNGDGFITVDELRSVLASLGLKQGKTIDDCKRMIMKVDVDGDGMVDFNEFRQMMKGGGFSALG